MSANNLPSIEYLRQLVDYDPDTGLFTYRYMPSMCQTRNTRFAGKPAFRRKRRKYLSAVVDGTEVYAHRAAWAHAVGEWPHGEVDHVNHDTTDNRLCNLRVVDRNSNTRNLPKASNNTSGATGVYWFKQMQCWTARIRVDRKLVSLGCFDSFDDAAAARKAAERQFGFHANHGIDAKTAQ
jgi:hypothetical protein